MESLSYNFDGRGLPFNDDAIEALGFSPSISPDLENSGDDTGDQSGGKSVITASTNTLNSLMDFGTRLPCSTDNKGTRLPCSTDNKATDENLAASSESTQHRARCFADNSALSAKRARITNLQSQIPTCQVHGCNKDLSSSKDYHKRHKVCDVHSKTAVVIVNGIRQRFCQQCSRFHILAEFDEGKRSCRKRLAGHNERRRKPHFDTHLGSSYFTTAASKSSLLFSGILPSGFLGLQCNEPTDHIARMRLKDEQNQLSDSALHMKLSQSIPQSILHLYGSIGKPYPLLPIPESPAGANCSRVLSLLSQNSNHQTTLDLIRNSIPDHSVDFEASQEPNGLDLKRYLSTEGANTVDLIELSLQLQRVEQQKHYAQVKLENGVFCQSTTT